ncbi:MAG: DUF4349 domain-containing protein [Bacilli bacterium]
MVRQRKSFRKTIISNRQNQNGIPCRIHRVPLYGTVKDLNKEATDISLQYQDTENKINSLLAEKDRLNELYADASIDDMILINKRISEIDLLLGELQGDLNRYDSLIEYSTVTLTIRASKKAGDAPFGKRLANSFRNGFTAVVIFLKYLLIGLTVILPAAIILGPVAVGIVVLRNYIKKKRVKEKKET